MDNSPIKAEDEEIEEVSLIKKDRSLLYMGLTLGVIIVVMGYLTFFVDDPWKRFKKEDVPVKVVDDKTAENNSILDKSSSMSDEEVRSSLIKFIEAYYYDQSRGYFDPPSYFANITETFYNFHNLTHSKVKEIYWKRRQDMENLRRVWIVSTLKFERQGSRILSTHWAKETYFRPSSNQQYSGIIQYEIIIDADGKIVSLRDIDVKDEVINTIEPDTVEVIGQAAQAVPVAPVAETPPAENKIYEVNALDVQPEFAGGQKELIRYVSGNIKYPLEARQKNIQGKVHVAFVIEKDGSVNDVKIRQGIGGGCDEEAIRILKNSPKWKPGMLKGTAVRSNFVLPITFQLAQ